MKYVITKDQNERLKEIIFWMFDSYLRPIGGWDPEKYVRQLEIPINDYELFLDLEEHTEDGELDEHNHMFYSMCENPNYTYTRKNQCPEVVIPNNIFDTLSDSFGKKIWKPYFLEWFTKNTSLPVSKVRKF